MLCYLLLYDIFLSKNKRLETIWTEEMIELPNSLASKCLSFSGRQKALRPQRRPFCPIPVHPSLPAAAAGWSHVSKPSVCICLI